MYEEYKRDHVIELTDQDILHAASEGEKERGMSERSRSGIVVKGLYDVAVHLSKCCSPVPGDEIVGYITRGRGVSIHRKDCSNLASMDIEPGRFINVAWAEDESQDYYIAQIQIHAVESKGIYFVVTKTINDMDIEAVSISGGINKDKEAVIDISVKIKTTRQLNAMLKKLRMIPDVVDVFRVGK